MEEIKLTKNVRNEAVSADISGMVQSSDSELQINETEALYSIFFLVYKNTWIYQ